MSRKVKSYCASITRSKIQRVETKRKLINARGGKCVDCGYSNHLAALDFDHVNPDDKDFTIASKLSIYPYIDLLIEAEKCVIRCANCHRIKTYPDATD